MATTETKWRSPIDNSIKNNSINKNTNIGLDTSTEYSSGCGCSSNKPDIPYPDSNFSKMFQNIYSTGNTTTQSTVKEGFDIFGEDFNLHKKPKSVINTSWAKDLGNIFAKIRDYILCPIYKSDELIDRGIKSALTVFLAKECINIDFSANLNGETEIIDMADLIDPNLLYNETTDSSGVVYTNTIDSFTTIKQSSSTEGFSNKEGLKNKTDCNAKEKAEQAIEEYGSMIKEEIYRILFLPVIIHIFYNIYFMFCYTDLNGERVHFIDVETEYYNVYFKPYLDYFLGIVIKPLTIFYFVLDKIAGFKPLRKFNDEFPYVSYILLFLLVMS